MDYYCWYVQGLMHWEFVFLSRFWFFYYWTFRHRINIVTSISDFQTISSIKCFFFLFFIQPLHLLYKANSKWVFPNYKECNRIQVIGSFLLPVICYKSVCQLCTFIHLYARCPAQKAVIKVKIVNVNISWISTLAPFTQHHLIFNIIEIVIAILGKKSSQNKTIKWWKIAVKE